MVDDSARKCVSESESVSECIFVSVEGAKYCSCRRRQPDDGRSGHLLHPCTLTSVYNSNYFYGTERPDPGLLAMSVTR